MDARDRVLQFASLRLRAADRLATAWVGVQNLIFEEFPLGTISDHIKRRRSHEVLRSMDRVMENAAKRYYEFILDEYHKAMILERANARGLLGRIGVIEKADIVVPYGRYGINNPIAQAAHQRNRFRLIRQVTDEQRRTLHSIMDNKLFWGRNPVDAARAMRGSLGLTAYQNQLVDNYKDELLRGSGRALQRKLRDGRFDRTALRAAQGEPIPYEKVNRMTARYRQRWIKHRAETIGRTEALRAINEGKDGMWEDLVEQGIIQPSEYRRHWVVTQDGRLRDSHEAMPDLNEGGRRVGEAFVSGEGNLLMRPGDPSAPPSDTVNCRCTLVYQPASQTAPMKQMELEGLDLPGPMKGVPVDARLALAEVTNRHVPRKMPTRSHIGSILTEVGQEGLFTLGYAGQRLNEARMLHRGPDMRVLDELMSLGGLSTVTGRAADELLPGVYDADGRYSPGS